MTDAERVDTAQLALDDLVAEMRKWRKRNRLLTVAVGVMLVLLVAVGLVANSAHHTADAVKRNSAADAAALEVQRLTSCRLINQGNRVSREGLGSYTDGIDALITDPSAQAAVDAKLRGSIPDPEKQDRDCNGDGGLDGADYPS